jgi:hypothetical protein
MIITGVLNINVNHFIYDGVFHRLEYEIGHKLY